MKKLLTSSEMAEVLSITTRHLFDLTKEGKIKSIRIGASVRYDMDDVLNDVKMGTASSPTPNRKKKI